MIVMIFCIHYDEILVRRAKVTMPKITSHIFVHTY